MYPKRPKFGLFSEKFSLVVCLLCTPTNWPKTGGQIWGPSAFKTRQTVWETGSVGSARSSAELPHDSLRDFEGASPAKRPREFIMPRAARHNDPSHVGSSDASDVTGSGSLACAVAEMCPVFAPCDGKEREGGEEGDSTTPPKEMKLAQDKRAFSTWMVR